MVGKQITNIEVKRSNRNRIFRYICKKDTVSNPDIAYDLKISLPTVTQNTKELIGKGLVEEVGEMKSTGGRRAKALSVCANFKVAVGLDITKNHIGLVLTNLKGEILKYDRIAMSFKFNDEYWQEVNNKLKKFLDDKLFDKNKILGIGISIPGIVDLNAKEITYSHILKLESIPFSVISKYFEYPCNFINDANAGAYAEGVNGEPQSRFFYLSLSNTVGGAIFSNMELIQGEDFRCGEVGHMIVEPNGKACYCGTKGCLDSYCSAKILAQSTDGKLGVFFERLESKDKAALKLWKDYISYLSLAVNNIYMVLNCEIILGGYVGSYADTFISQVRERMAKTNIFSKTGDYIRACKYKIEAAALGAALKVVEQFIEDV